MKRPKTKKTKPYLVRVYWHDATNIAEWQTYEEMSEWADSKTFECENVGYLVRSTKKYIVIAGRVSWQDFNLAPQYGLCERLPLKMVDRIEKLFPLTKSPKKPNSRN